LFKGVLEARITLIDDELKLFVAQTLADMIGQPTVDEILPSALDLTVGKKIAEAIVKKYVK
jgi:malate dehydrogenase (oxaloacetate-decarboxylating)